MSDGTGQTENRSTAGLGERNGIERAMAALDSPTVVDVLVAHQRMNGASCLCGWSQLGRSHPAHQLAEIVVAVRAAVEL